MNEIELFSRMMVMACETRLGMVAYWKSPTSERRGRKGFAEDAESKKIHRFSLRPLRILCVLCVWLLIFSHASCPSAALIEYLTIIRK
jgi:hypothetical protein